MGTYLCPNCGHSTPRYQKCTSAQSDLVEYTTWMKRFRNRKVADIAKKTTMNENLASIASATALE